MQVLKKLWSLERVLPALLAAAYSVTCLGYAWRFHQFSCKTFSFLWGNHGYTEAFAGNVWGLGVANWLYLGADLGWRVWCIRVSIDGLSKASVLRLFQARCWGRKDTINFWAALLKTFKR
jgi:hypothetical protein